MIQNNNIYYHSGGSGLTLSKKALDSIYLVLITAIELWYILCPENLKDSYDILLCYFLQNVGCKMVIIKNKYFACNHVGKPCCTNYLSKVLDDNANKYKEIVAFHSMTLSNFDELTTFINTNNNDNDNSMDSEDTYILEKPCTCIEHNNALLQPIKQIVVENNPFLASINKEYIPTPEVAEICIPTPEVAKICIPTPEVTGGKIIPDCTIVTACYNFNKFNSHARNFDTIKKDMDTLLQVKCYLVIFCDMDCYTYIKEQRSKYRLDNITKIYIREFDELFCAQFLNKVIENRKIYYPSKDLRTNEHTHLIQCNKFDFALQIMNNNPFKTSKFAWIDCFLKENASNVCKNYKQDTIPNILNKVTDKFHIEILNVCDKKYKLIENKKEYYERYRYVVCGGIFTCGIEIGKKILTRLNQIFVETTMLGYGHGEEMFYLEILDEFYDDIVRGYGDYNILLDNILEPKENYPYMIQIILKSYIAHNYYKEAYDCSIKLLEYTNNNNVMIESTLYFEFIILHYIILINYKKEHAKQFSLLIQNKYIKNPHLQIEYDKKKDFYDKLLNLSSNY